MTRSQPAGDGAGGTQGAEVTPEHCEQKAAVSKRVPGSWTITIESALPMLNLNQRYHWAKKAQLTKHWRRLALVNAMAADLPRGLDRVHITAYVIKPTARQYDVHNLMPTLKACVDGLVTDYGLLPDDTNAHLVGPDLRQGGKGEAAIIITITEEPQ